MAVKGINGADLNNISKVDGRSNVLDKVNGIDADLTPPAAAYSVRNVSGLTGISYDGPAMRILVDATGDGADATDLEFDINFTADGDLDVADIELKCAGGKDAYVVKWYDQSGAGNDAVQTSYASMPKICSAGSVILENGKPAVRCQPSTADSQLVMSTAVSAVTMSVVVKVDTQNASSNSYLWSDTPYNSGSGFHAGGGSVVRTGYGVQIVTPVVESFQGTVEDLDQHLITYHDGTTDTLYQDGTSYATGTLANTPSIQRIGSRNINTLSLIGKLQEIVLYDTATRQADRTDIETNINSYFNIYQSRENILPGAAAAYSLRQLSDSSRLAVRVRRDTGVGSGTDDDEADVGFDANGELSLASPVSNFDPTGSSATTLGEFLADAAYDDEDSLGAPADGFVTAWYDQSVNANSATQANPASQPKIYDSSTGLITENGKPAVDFNTNVLEAVSIFSQSSAVLSFFIVFKEDDTNAANRAVVLSGNVEQLTEIFAAQNFAFGNTQIAGHRRPENQQVVVGTANNNQNLFAYWKNGTNNQNLSVNAGTAGSNTNSVTTTTLTDIYLGAAASNLGNPLNGQIQEFVLWFSDQDTAGNRTDIESNINAHYGIANFGTPSSGLLADYPGSAAAYSVRKLADTASLAMRIIVDDTAVIGTVDASDTEYDIGFDANGDLDVARIREVCNNPSGANYNAYVVTWYDQSGNGNHATQATYTQCPQIYDGVDVIMENGKPAMSEWYDNTAILIASFGTTYNDVHVFSVSNDAGGTGVIGYVVSGDTGTNFRIGRNAGGSDIFLYDGASAFSTTAEATGQALISSTNETTPTAFFDGSSRSFNNTLSGNGMSGAYIGRHPSLTSGGMRGTIQELIIFSAYQSTDNRKAIETDIDSYYRIYGDPDDGLLSTPYGKGAAAAYSVRQLSNNATRAMRILVDADANGPDASDNEYDIGFDANGELDIAKIEELCDKGTGNYDAYVTTWYDQSGEGNDATQATHASMPKICNAGTVILENGKPAIEFNGTSNSFTGVAKAASTPAETMATVLKLSTTSGEQRIVSHPTSSDASGTQRFRMTSSQFRYQDYEQSPTLFTTATISADTNQNLLFGFVSDTGKTAKLFKNSVSGTDGTTLTKSLFLLSEAETDIKIGRRRNAESNFFSGKWQEYVRWDSDRESNRPLIEANINDYFGIEGV